MEKIMRRIVPITLCLALILSITPAKPTQAASKRTAMKAYATFLAKHPAANISDSDYNNASYQRSDLSYISYFFLHDLEGDGVPELFAYTSVNFRWFIVKVYTYKNGKVTAYRFKNGSKAVFDDCATANGAYDFYICKKGHVHNNYGGYYGVSQTTYKVSGKKLKTLYSYETDVPSEKEVAKKGNKRISVKKYNKYVKKCKAINVKLRGNRASNRKKLVNGTAKVE